jgi:hypothetical membrane protein
VPIKDVVAVRLASARAGAAMWLLSAAVYLTCEAVAAASSPRYSYVEDYISDLGASAVMNVGAFMLHGSLFLLGAVAVMSAYPALGWAGRSFALAALANAIGNVLVGTFPSGAFAAADVNWHVIGAGLAIVGGNVAVIIAGIGSRRIGAAPSFRRPSVAIGLIGLVCLLALVIDSSTGSRVLPVGLLERGAVYSTVAWELLAGVTILRGSRGPASS